MKGRNPKERFIYLPLASQERHGAVQAKKDGQLSERYEAA